MCLHTNADVTTSQRQRNGTMMIFFVLGCPGFVNGTFDQDYGQSTILYYYYTIADDSLSMRIVYNNILSPGGSE